LPTPGGDIVDGAVLDGGASGPVAGLEPGRVLCNGSEGPAACATAFTVAADTGAGSNFGGSTELPPCCAESARAPPRIIPATNTVRIVVPTTIPPPTVPVCCRL
jgi:hypothetical protein